MYEKSEKMVIVKHALEGKASSSFNLKENITSFDIFKEQFLEEFYSIPIRVRFKKQWMERRCHVGTQSLQGYFYDQVAKARFFIPKLTEFEINYNIVQQYPPWVRETLSTINFGETNVIVQALGNLDTIRTERNRDEKKFGNNFQPRKQEIKVNRVDIETDTRHERKKYNRSNGYTRRNRRTQYYDQHNSYYRDHNRNGAQFNLPDTRFPPPPPNSYNTTTNVNSKDNNSQESENRRDLN